MLRSYERATAASESCLFMSICDKKGCNSGDRKAVQRTKSAHAGQIASGLLTIRSLLPGNSGGNKSQ
jgi:hypothetical protein